MKKIFSFLAVCFAAVVLLASCTKKYTVDFDVDGGYVVDAIEVVEGEVITAPTTTKEDMTLLGWYADIDLTEEYDFTQPVTENLTLYAKWGVTLSFDSKGGSAVDPIVGAVSSFVEALPTPTREGFVFDGWFKEETYENAQTIVLPAKNATVYARWSVKDDTTALDLNNWTIQDAGSYKYSVAENGDQTFQAVNPHLVINKSNGEWAGVWSNTTGAAIKAMTKLTVEVKGTAGQQLLVKLNDQGGACEKWVDMDGTVQTVEFAFPEGVTINEGATALVFMANGGKNEASGDYVFTKVLFDNGETGDKLATVDLLKNGWSSGVEYTVESYIGTDTYSFVKTYINHDVTEYNAIIMEVVGTEGCQILLKLEQGGIEAPTEQAFTMTGEAQTITWIVSDKFLTKTGGEMFLWFLNPGNAGATAGAEEYVTIKSAGLYKLVAEGNENKESSIFFNENGGSAVDTITQAIGSDVAAPAEPTRDGFKFAGWYTDEALTQAYTFGKMPETTIELFAAWEKASDRTVDVLHDTYVALDADTYEIAHVNGVLTIKKTGTGEWQFGKGTLTGKDIAGLTYLKITIKGVAGQRITFKINDKLEKQVECDGTVQNVVFNFEDLEINEGAPALLFFVNGGEAKASEVFEISRLEFSSYPDNLNVLNDTYTPLDADTYEIGNANGLLTIKKTGTGEWQFGKGTLTGASLVGYKKLIVTIKGVAGQRITFKINDQLEKQIECDGTVQTLVFDFSEININQGAAALLFFVNGGEAKASEVFEISRLEFSAVNDPLNMIADTFTELDANTYEIANTNGVLTIKKIGTGEWQFGRSTLTGAALVGYTSLKVTVKGVAGQRITLKINDQVEKHIDCDGTVQTITYDITDIKINEGAAALLFFVNGGEAKASEVFEITELVFKN